MLDLIKIIILLFILSTNALILSAEEISEISEQTFIDKIKDKASSEKNVIKCGFGNHDFGPNFCPKKVAKMLPNKVAKILGQTRRSMGTKRPNAQGHGDKTAKAAGKGGAGKAKQKRRTNFVWPIGGQFVCPKAQQKRRQHCFANFLTNLLTNCWPICLTNF